MADCHLPKADLSPVFQHGDKVTYHVLNHSVNWVASARSAQAPPSTRGLPEWRQSAFESIQQALARGLSVRRSPFLQSVRQPALSPG